MIRTIVLIIVLNLCIDQTIAAESKQFIYVTDLLNNRVQKFDFNGNYVGQFGSKGTGNGQFSNMHEILAGKAGNIWVTDGPRIEEFTGDGKYLAQLPIAAGGGFTIDTDGAFWVLGDGLEKYSSNGTLIGKFGTTLSGCDKCVSWANPGKGDFSFPHAITIDKDGNMYVADSGNNRVQKFDRKGKYLSQFGTQGSGDGQFNYPMGVAVDQKGNVWVVDSWNSRVQEFNSHGKYLMQFGSKGTTGGRFIYPVGIISDSDGNIWVVDMGYALTFDWYQKTQGIARVQEFDNHGHYLRQFGSFGAGKGQFRYPEGIAISK